jgi:hypothetical protein
LGDIGSTNARVDAGASSDESRDGELATLRQQVSEQATQIAELTRLLDRARNDPIADLRSRYIESDLVRGYSDDEREVLFNHVVLRMRRLPKQHQIGPALEAARRYRDSMAEIEARFRDDGSAEPSLEELQQQAREESAAWEEVWARWVMDVHRAFADDADAYADLTQR